MPGITLNKAMVARNPLIRADQTREDRLAYRDWALGIMAEVEEALRSFHREGVVFGDLHPNNIIVTDEGRPVFIDSPPWRASGTSAWMSSSAPARRCPP